MLVTPLASLTSASNNAVTTIRGDCVFLFQFSIIASYLRCTTLHDLFIRISARFVQTGNKFARCVTSLNSSDLLMFALVVHWLAMACLIVWHVR